MIKNIKTSHKFKIACVNFLTENFNMIFTSQPCNKFIFIMQRQDANWQQLENPINEYIMRINSGCLVILLRPKIWRKLLKVQSLYIVHKGMQHTVNWFQRQAEFVWGSLQPECRAANKLRLTIRKKLSWCKKKGKQIKVAVTLLFWHCIFILCSAFSVLPDWRISHLSTYRFKLFSRGYVRTLC